MMGPFSWRRAAELPGPTRELGQVRKEKWPLLADAVVGPDGAPGATGGARGAAGGRRTVGAVAVRTGPVVAVARDLGACDVAQTIALRVGRRASARPSAAAHVG